MMKETSDIEEVASDHPRAGCSPCCDRKDQTDSPPMLPSKPLLYSGDLVKPSQGTLPSSKTGFLVSFLVDARGGAMTGHRHWGMRVIIPPAAVQQPTRINCRYQQLSSLPFPPPFMEREALASRVIEISPSGEVFRSPVLIEIPHFSSNAGAERETVVLRSEDGESWSEHVSDTVSNGEIYQDVVTSVVMKDSEDLERIYDVLEVSSGRVIRILTSRFPKYFAIVSRVREEVCTMSPEGGKLVLDTEPRLRVTFPKKAVYKKIKVGLQVQSVPQEIVQAAFGRSVEVSRIVAVEPRRRKFHQPIFVSIPLPCPASKLSSNSLSLRLICSITGSMEEAAWEDLTGSTPLELCKDVVHFSTKVSGIFWLLVIHDQQRDAISALTQANRLFKEASLVPYLARFSVFYRENFPRAWVNTVRVYCMTDDKAEKVIQSLQGFRPLAISGDVEVSNGCEIAVKLNGNVLKMKQDPFTSEIVPVSTVRSSDIKEPFIFRAFEENSLTLLVQPKDPGQPMTGSLSFARRLTGISATQQISLCKLDFDVESKEIQRGEVQAPFLDAYEQPIKEEVMFTAESPENHSTGPVDSPIANGHSKPNCEREVPSEDIEEENPYEKVEVNNSVMLDRKSGNFSKGYSKPVGNKKTDQIPSENFEIISKKTTKEQVGQIKLPHEERLLNSNGSATLERKKTKEKKKSKGFSNDDLELYRTEFAKTQGVRGVGILKSSSKDPTATQENSVIVSKSDKLVEKGNDEKVADALLAKPTSEVFALKEKSNQGQRASNIEVEDKKVDVTNNMGVTNNDLNISHKDHDKSVNDKKNIIMQEIDMTGFRNLAYEREQQRIDNLMKKKADETGLKEDQDQDLSNDENKITQSKTVEEDNKKIIKMGTTTTLQEHVSESSKKEIVESNSDVTTTFQTTISETVVNVSDKTTQNIDPSIAKHIQENIFTMTDSNMVQDKKNEQKVQEDMKEFRNIAYEREQMRIDKLMKAKVETNRIKKGDISHDNLKKPSAMENKEYIDIAVPGKDSASSEPNLIDEPVEIISDSPTQNVDPSITKHIQENISVKPECNTVQDKKTENRVQKDMNEFQNIAYEREQMRIDKLMKAKVETESIKKDEISHDNHQKPSTAKNKECIETVSSKSKLITSRLDPVIAQHIKENIFIKVEKPQPVQKDVDIIGFDVVPENVETTTQTEKALEEKSIVQSDPLTTSDRYVNISDEQSAMLNSEEKKKKRSFVKDWQQDLKEFFSLGKVQKKKEKHNFHQKRDEVENINENEVVRKEDEINEEEAETTYTKEPLLFEKMAENEDTWVKNLDPEIVKHIHDNIFISQSRIQTIDQEKENNVDLVEPKETCNGNNKDNEQPQPKSRRNRKDRRKTNSECFTADIPGDNEATKLEQVVSKMIETEEMQTKKEEIIKNIKIEKTVQRMKKEETVQNRKETSILSIGGKPKVVVPSPKGIPRPLPKKKSSAEDSKRDSMVSRDSFEDMQKVIDSSEIDLAVDSFDQLYLQQENEETMRTSMDSETITQTLTEGWESKSFEKEEKLQEDSKPWKELNKGNSFDTQDPSRDSFRNGINESQECTKSEHQIVNIQDIQHEYEESKLVQVLRDFQASEANTVQEAGDGQVRYSEVEKNVITRSMEAQESLQSSLQEIEKIKIEETDETDVIRIQKHSLSLQDGELVELVNIKTCRPGEFPSEKVLSNENEGTIIDPESLRNVDGQSRQRKGSKGLHDRKEKYGRRQGSKSKSPGESWASHDEEEIKEEESKGETSNLTARLEETTERMRKVSQVLDGDAEGGLEEVEHQTSVYPLARTSKVVVKADGGLPLDNVIERMVKRPEENLSSSLGGIIQPATFDG